MHRGSIPSRVLAILEVEDGWMTVYALVADLELRWGDVKLATVRRAMHRLVDKQLVTSRLVDMPSLDHERMYFKEMEVRAA
jgi:Fe2+ or Zn2+ uptake regulation protein